jgi:large subunit ribosomal protein L21
MASSGTSYAIVEAGGKQYRAEKGESILVDRLAAEEGEKLTLRPVMYRGDGNVVVEVTELEKVKVEAVVAEHLRGRKVRIFKYKPKKGYRRRAGHRQGLTRLEISDVRMLTRKPAAKKAEAKPAEKKPAEKKPAAKKPAARKSAEKQPAAKRKPSSGRRSSSGGRSSSANKRN